MNKYSILIGLSVFLSALARDPFLLPEKPTLVLRHYPIQYSDAADIAKKINLLKNKLRSKEGHAFSEQHSNSLWVYDNAIQLKKISQFIASFDKKPRQILIKAVIAIIDRKSLYELGTYFEEESDNETSSNYQSMLSTIHIPLIKFGSENSFVIKLTSLEKNGRALIISEPELITINRNTASISSGDEIPYSQKTEETSTTLFKKALLQLEVTPTLLPENTIRLDLNLHQDKPSALLIDGIPAIKTQQINTTVIVKSKQTLVLGGIHEQNYSIENSNVPLLRKIPIIGKLFQNKQQENNQQQLLIMITPRLLS